ncbi:protein NDUFAF4 homolog [Centruroides vittatus]|uniref:protein NDUFAF4 homolog n=1 Tax=Centruroides vittatus TaxID=120091 RepID=UPI0035101CA8
MSAYSKMGRVFSSLIKRPLRNFNVDNRALKVIESEKPRPAPRHRPELNKREPVVRESKEQWTGLLDRLKSVKITSYDPVKEESKKDDGKVLPQNKSYVKSSEYGVFEATSVPQGKISLRQVIEFLNKHQTDPNLWNAKLIAKEYKLDLTMTEQILKHFSLYSVAFPDEKYKPSRFLSLNKYQKYLPKKSSSNTVEAVKS